MICCMKFQRKNRLTSRWTKDSRQSRRQNNFAGNPSLVDSVKTRMGQDQSIENWDEEMAGRVQSAENVLKEDIPLILALFP